MRMIADNSQKTIERLRLFSYLNFVSFRRELDSLVLQVSFAMNQLATAAATAGPRGKGQKRTRSSASQNGTGKHSVGTIFFLILLSM